MLRRFIIAGEALPKALDLKNFGASTAIFVGLPGFVRLRTMGFQRLIHGAFVILFKVIEICRGIDFRIYETSLQPYGEAVHASH